MTFPLNYKVYPVLSAAQISMKFALASTENLQAVFFFFFLQTRRSLGWLKSSVKNNFLVPWLFKSFSQALPCLIYFICSNVFLNWFFCDCQIYITMHTDYWHRLVNGCRRTNIQRDSVCLKVALSRIPTFWASLLRCTVTLINAFFHWTSQHTHCSSADSRSTQHSHKNKRLSLAT